MDPFHHLDQSPDIRLNNSNFDSFPDISLPPNSPFLPGTPSYNGSYQGSPYSGPSELDFDIKDGDLSTSLFAPTDLDSYDPNSYDAPADSGLLMFNDDFMSSADTSHVSLSLTPAEDMQSPQYYDHSSPGSSNGGAESGPENDYRHSPASSASSNRHRLTHSSPHIAIHDLHVNSPNLLPGQLPSDRAPSPYGKASSPPQLVIPDGGQQHSAAPTINAPSGGGGLGGPQLHIVPATPVVGGDDASQSVAYPNNFMSQGSRNTAAAAGPSRFGGQASFNFPGSDQYSALSGTGPPGVSVNVNVRGQLATGSEEFLLPPSPSRVRSKSDTSLRPPQPQTWSSSNEFNHNQGAMPDLSAYGLNQTLPSHQTDLDSQLPSSLRNTSSPAPSSFGQQLHPGTALPNPFNFASNNGLLAPDLAVNLRRARSDGNSSMRNTHRQVRSEDLRPTVGSNNGSSGLSYPPSQHQDFIRSQQQQMQSMNRTTFLTPEPLPSINRIQHHRRTSSGSRERGAGSGLLGNSVRMSPYPSPNASPANIYEPLPNVGVSSSPGIVGPEGLGSAPMSRTSTPGPIAKPTVTTTATADASMKRRINEAKFVCDVPGCNSTFTRHFNLKGHKRSHMDEKPFVCKWPGCGKGFARQHDCKRHEQLHSNHRPFTCEGCKKPFARLDALNRHLKSEGGAGCARLQEAIDAEKAREQQHQPQLPNATTANMLTMPSDIKVDSDWMTAGVVM